MSLGVILLFCSFRRIRAVCFQKINGLSIPRSWSSPKDRGAHEGGNEGALAFLPLCSRKCRGRLLVSLHIDYTIGVFNNKDSPSGYEQYDGGHSV